MQSESPGITVDPEYIKALKERIQENEWALEGRNTKPPLILTGALVLIAIVLGAATKSSAPFVCFIPTGVIAWRMYFQYHAAFSVGVSETKLRILEKLLANPVVKIVDREKG